MIHLLLCLNYQFLHLSAITLFIGVTFPFFGDLLGFFGGFGFAPTSYFVSLLNVSFLLFLQFPNQFQ